jgi:glycosyltransferase involved in cell wall biosynthesis
MGGGVQTRVIYWCGWLDPQMVAVSKEMCQLMQAFPKSMAFGVSSHHRLAFHPWQHRFGVHQALYPLMKWSLPYLERRFDLNHVYTSLADWHFLNVLGQRPIVLTVTQRGVPADGRLLRKVRRVVTESEALAEDARSAGVPDDRVSVIYPGVDLETFRAVPPPPVGRWKCLFASSPENMAEVHTKGLDLLLQLAERDPSFELVVLWRPFGPGSDDALREIRARCGTNVQIHAGRVANIHEFYAASHFVVAPFRNVGKPCPNSVLEGLAVGRPALVSESVDIGCFLERERVAVRFPCTIEGIQGAFVTMCREYTTLQANSRSCAVAHFDLAQLIRRYSDVYDIALASAVSE